MSLEYFGFEDMLRELSNDIIPEITDFTKKEIGDRVSIIDYSSVSRLNSKRPLTNEDLYNIQYFIVIDCNLKYKYNSNNITYIQDLIIVNPIDKEMYRICSRHVTLFI